MRGTLAVSLLVLATCGCSGLIDDKPCEPGCTPDGKPFYCANGVATLGACTPDGKVVECGEGHAWTARCDRCMPSGACLGKDMKLSANNYLTCLLDHAGAVWCWGGALVGAQLGTGNSDPVPVFAGNPKAADLPEPSTDISVGYAHVCAISKSGAVYCWGSDLAGQSSGTTPDANVPLRAEPTRIPGVEAAESVTAGLGHTCALTTSGVYCWGLDNLHQCGADGASVTPYTPEPTRVDLHGVTSVETVRDHTCAIAGDQSVWCWGSNLRLSSFDLSQNNCQTPCRSGQVGARDADSSLPRRVVPGSVAALGMGVTASYALTDTKEVLGWGWGDGQLGSKGASGNGCASGTSTCDPGFDDAPTRIQLPPGELPERLLRSDGSDACVQVHDLTKGDTWVCWGTDNCGELGRGPGGVRQDLSPGEATVLHPGATAPGAFARGADHGCFIDDRYDVWCFGNEYLLGADSPSPPDGGGIDSNGNLACPSPRPTPVKVVWN